MLLQILEHPLAKHLLGILRDKCTQQAEYRDACNRISYMLAIEATKTLPTEKTNISTPLEDCEAEVICYPIVVIPILRAGLGMLPSFLEMFPNASVGYIGLERDEDTAIATEYYCKLPILNGSKIFIIDPMLATGGSACKALEVLQNKVPSRDCTLLSILSAPEGISRVQKEFPPVHIVTAAIDRQLDINQYIRPGLGDFGDRLFGT